MSKIIIILLFILILNINTASATWVASSSVNSGLGDLGLLSTPDVFYHSGTWKMISGGVSYPGFAETWYSAYWTGSVWVPDASIKSGIGGAGDYAAPTVFEKDGTLYLIVGKYDGNFIGFNWTGSTWQSDPSIVVGLDDIGIRASPTVFDDSGTWKLISGSEGGAVFGFHWNGTGWESNASVINGLAGVSRGAPDVFLDGSTWKLIMGEFHGRFYGHYWTGSAWVSDPSIVSGLPTILNIGHRSSPSVFYDGDWKIISGNDDGVFIGYVIDTPPVTSSLLTDSQVNPANVAITPDFSWTYFDADSDLQTSYQIYVGTSSGASDMWNSGVITSSLTNDTYNGTVLTRGDTFYVQARTNDGWVWSSWDTGTFVVNLLPDFLNESIEVNNELIISVDALDIDGTTTLVYVRINEINYTMVNSVGDTWKYTSLITDMNPGTYEINGFYAQDNTGEWGFESSTLDFEITTGETPVIIAINKYNSFDITVSDSVEIIHAPFFSLERGVKNVITLITEETANFLALILVSYIGVFLILIILKRELTDTILYGTLGWILILLILLTGIIDI